MKVCWTPTARKTYFNILKYLEEAWTKKEIQSFVNAVEKVIQQIAVDPYMFEASRKQKYIRKGYITKHNTLYYRVKPRKKQLELIAFWDNREDPKKLIY